jgi:hypothetical protein
VVADFIDLKSPYMAGHSRRCAQLSTDAARLLRFTDVEITAPRRAALVHELEGGEGTALRDSGKGHGKLESVNPYVHADLALKERAFARRSPFKAGAVRYRRDGA